MKEPERLGLKKEWADLFQEMDKKALKISLTKKYKKK
jgi:hypothetical protein